MESNKNIIYRSLELLFVILVVGIVPSTAHAHSGLERFTPYVMLFGLVVGSITGVVCVFRHLSFRDAILPSFGIYLIILVVGGFFLPGGATTWSAIPIIIFFSIVLGGVGFIPLSLAGIATSFILNRLVSIFGKSRGKL